MPRSEKGPGTGGLSDGFHGGKIITPSMSGISEALSDRHGDL